MLLLRRCKQWGGGGAAEWIYSDLPTRHAGGTSQLWLGVPTVLQHAIDESSPLRGVSLQATGDLHMGLA